MLGLHGPSNRELQEISQNALQIIGKMAAQVTRDPINMTMSLLKPLFCKITMVTALGNFFHNTRV